VRQPVLLYCVIAVLLNGVLAVCTKNLNPHIMVMKPTQDRV
jgi:hypothetical protein